MIKIKTQKSAGMIQWVIKSQKGQQLGERELYSINSNEVQGLLHLQAEKKATSFKLIYNVSGFITFKEFLSMPLNKDGFARILSNILMNLKSMQQAYFNPQCVLLDLDRVLVNPATQHIYFTYVPIQGFDAGTPLREFLLNIIQYCAFVPGEDRSYVKEYITILNNGINFSEFELEEYIHSLFDQGPTFSKTECPQCHVMMREGTNYCPACGFKVSGNTGNFGKGVYDPLSGDTPVQESEEVVYTPPVEMDTIRKDHTQGLSDGTTVLGADPGGTTVLGSEELDLPNYPFLIREKNQEKILVDKPVFRIGKEKNYCDYCVMDNNAVSRSHADIITRETRYYIIDRNSTNRTYLDGRAIPTQTEVEIFSGTGVRLANEDFVFYIES